jgi:hypothetical protein
VIEKRGHTYCQTKEVSDPLFFFFYNATTLAALEGVQESDLADYVTSLADRMARALSEGPERAGMKLETARARYRFIEA